MNWFVERWCFPSRSPAESTGSPKWLLVERDNRPAFAVSRVFTIVAVGVARTGDGSWVRVISSRRFGGESTRPRQVWDKGKGRSAVVERAQALCSRGRWPDRFSCGRRFPETVAGHKRFGVPQMICSVSTVCTWFVAGNSVIDLHCHRCPFGLMTL